jgi:RNA polymerase sigma-70 factor (ECF subfamily)
MIEETVPGVVETLVAQHARFLKFLEPRAGSRAAAEELLQAAFVKALEREDELREPEYAGASMPGRLVRLHGRGRRRP